MTPKPTELIIVNTNPRIKVFLVPIVFFTRELNGAISTYASEKEVMIKAY